MKNVTATTLAAAVAPTIPKPIEPAKLKAPTIPTAATGGPGVKVVPLTEVKTIPTSDQP